MSAHSDTRDQLPAILGGEPVRAQGPPPWPGDDPAVAEALQRALADRSWGQYYGGNCERLAEALAAYHACEHVQLCSSGTAATELALRGLKVGTGDEVILAAYDFKANFQNVLTVGATPVLVDLHPSNWNLDPSRVEEAVGPATKAIIVSHLHGGCVPIWTVMETARRHGLAVIEDACQMTGADLSGRKAGMWGDVGVLSFGGSKLLTAGRGGALLTNNSEIAQRVRLYAQRGNDAYPLSELQAAVLLPQLAQLDEHNRRREENVCRLLRHLTAECGLAAFYNEPADDVAESRPAFYKLGVQYDPRRFSGLPRDTLTAAVRAEGIALDAGFRALHRIHSARRFRAVGELAQADAADKRVVTLHHPVLLEGADAIDQIVTALEKIRAHAEAIARSR